VPLNFGGTFFVCVLILVPQVVEACFPDRRSSAKYLQHYIIWDRYLVSKECGNTTTYGGVKMLYLFLCLIVVIASIFLLRRAGVSNPYSKGFVLAILLSIVAVICLAQNYTQSLIPEANDGIGVSNQVAYWIVGEDGWSIESFRHLFMNSIYFTLVIVLSYPLVVAVEKKLSSIA